MQKLEGTEAAVGREKLLIEVMDRKPERDVEK